MSASVGFGLLTTATFVSVALVFLFPMNSIVPLDRRLAGLLGASVCAIIHWMFPSVVHNVSVGSYVDVDVLLILLAIMGINFIVMRQPVLLKGIRTVKGFISSDPSKGFWLVSAVAFASSPFITNDGLCLLLTWPVLDAFQAIADVPNNELERQKQGVNKFYFCLAICCSANIGSAMTYTGNPQNIIIAGHLCRYMAGGAFFGLLIIPATICTVLSTWYLNYSRCWEIDNLNTSRNQIDDDSIVGKLTKATVWILSLGSVGSYAPVVAREDSTEAAEAVPNPLLSADGESHLESATENYALTSNPSINVADESAGDHISLDSKVDDVDPSPGSYPEFVFPVFGILIILELTGQLPLVDIFVITAILLAGLSILIIYYRPYVSRWWQPDDAHKDSMISDAERRKVIMKYIEALFTDLDYNLIIIFIGLFIISGSFVKTGVPGAVWGVVAGSRATSFRTMGSITLISMYIIVFSQLVGNVPLVFMAAEEMDLLPVATQKYGWVLLAWVSTVAGNFTLCGSAANIIVAEKASRHKNGVHIGAIKHFYVCGLVTLILIVLGSSIISLEFIIFV